MAVIDASAAAALIVDLPWSAEARSEFLGQPERIAPQIFVAELVNVVWQNVRAGVISSETGLVAMREILPTMSFVSETRLLDEAVQLAVRHQHAVYDCFYLALVIESRQQLLTADMKLAALARRLGQPVKLLL